MYTFLPQLIILQFIVEVLPMKLELTDRLFRTTPHRSVPLTADAPGRGRSIHILGINGGKDNCGRRLLVVVARKRELGIDAMACLLSILFEKQ
ncbi:unnamed protein product [Peronospora belbahrii]|uniref:Secreted protein n=1 Tax=Peronospora belbahrii TaxID=622444 RepID=A0AAU9KQV1_9STRA|nr:unnamed protein product [Peronospora belbahrii]